MKTDEVFKRVPHFNEAKEIQKEKEKEKEKA
jgi:hypothetical protein